MIYTVKIQIDTEAETKDRAIADVKSYFDKRKSSELWDYPVKIIDAKLSTSQLGGVKRQLDSQDTIQVIARRWHDRVYGNTYHSCEVYVNNELVERVDFAYGYDESYMQTAREILDRHYDLGIDKTQPLWHLRDRQIKLLQTCTDVTRKRDL